MGGGTPLIEANRVGCDVEGLDINPMSAWIVREEIDPIDEAAYRHAAGEIVDALRAKVGEYYETGCPLYGDSDVPVKSFLWVKTLKCENCDSSVDLFPGFLLARASRHPTNVVICADCGELNEVTDTKSPGKCTECESALHIVGPARRGRCACDQCGQTNVYSGNPSAPLKHRLFAIEYHNPPRRAQHKGRFFKKPDADDLARVKAAAERWQRMTPRFVPEEEIPPGDESSRLHRWGYSRYRDMSNSRQLLGLELSCRLIAEVRDNRTRNALATNLSDLLRYQNMLCRYDTKALKSLDIFSVHGFPVGLVQCESNLLGISKPPRGNVGSGGWSNIVTKYLGAKRYCDAPFEVRTAGSRKVRVPIRGERIGQEANGRRRSVTLRCADAAAADFAPQSLDAVFTDPPYFGNVQYGELMDYCYAWLRRLAGSDTEGFDRLSTISTDELTGNATQARDLTHFTDGLSSVYCRVARALKPGAPLAFTFHHNDLEAYCAVGVAILDGGLLCTASLPCPAEMSGSIHIHGTASSIVDTVFVCRTDAVPEKRWLFDKKERLLSLVVEDRRQLCAAGREATYGDTRCVLLGHLTRTAVWNLRAQWDRATPTAARLSAVEEQVCRFGPPDELAEHALAATLPVPSSVFRPKAETHGTPQRALPL